MLVNITETGRITQLNTIEYKFIFKHFQKLKSSVGKLTVKYQH